MGFPGLGSGLLSVVVVSLRRSLLKEPENCFAYGTRRTKCERNWVFLPSTGRRDARRGRQSFRAQRINVIERGESREEKSFARWLCFVVQSILEVKKGINYKHPLGWLHPDSRLDSSE
jgi:hypothetical protein